MLPQTGQNKKSLLGLEPKEESEIIKSSIFFELESFEKFLEEEDDFFLETEFLETEFLELEFLEKDKEKLFFNKITYTKNR